MASLKNKLANKHSALSRQKQGDMCKVPVDRIKDNPHQPRKHFDEAGMEEMTASVRQSGVIQPVVIRRDRMEIFLVAGERRLRAARAAGLKEIPTILTEGNPAEIALIENLQLYDLYGQLQTGVMKIALSRMNFSIEIVWF